MYYLTSTLMVRIENLTCGYGKKIVFRDLNLNFRNGTIYGLLGKNGTGKTTLLNTIAGLRFPESGRLEVMKYAPSKRQPTFLEDIFFIPEEFQLPPLSIAQYQRYYSTFYPKFNSYEFNDYLKLFEISIGDKLQELSYGQRKKVLVSFGLAANTSLLLLDEPTNGLDIMGKSQVRKIIAGAFTDQKCIIVSSHQVKDLENLIDHIVIIDETGVILNQSLADIGEKLSFKISFDPGDLEWSIYHEPILRGHAIVAMNTDGIENKIDLELLYKATVSKPKLLNSIFND